MVIEDIIDIDNELIEQLNFPLGEICHKIEKSNYPKTLEAVLMLQFNITFLKMEYSKPLKMKTIIVCMSY